MIIKKKIFENIDITELVNTDGGIISGDRNAVSDSEIETGPVNKSFNDDSDYEKGISTTTDRASRYRQDLPWLNSYYSGQSPLTKQTMEETINDLVKKSNKKDGEFVDKNSNNIKKVTNYIENIDLTDDEIQAIKKYLDEL
jgi:hypothetical protein